MPRNYHLHLIGLPSDQTQWLGPLLDFRGYEVTRHEIFEDWGRLTDASDASCLITSLEFVCREHPGVLQALVRQPDAPVTVVLASEPDVPNAVRAMKEGAVEVLEAPIDPSLLYMAVESAHNRSKLLRARAREKLFLRGRYERLTRREREVLPLILGGWLVKQAAAALGIADITFQIHRTQVMRKMEANSVADLVRMGIKLGIKHAPSLYPDDLRALIPGVSIGRISRSVSARQSSSTM